MQSLLLGFVPIANRYAIAVKINKIRYKVTFTIVLERELNIRGNLSDINSNIGSEKICLVINAAKKTIVQMITISNSPANVSNCFITGLEGATVLKILESP